VLASVHKPMMPVISELLDSTFSNLDEETHRHRLLILLPQLEIGKNTLLMVHVTVL